MTKEQNLLSLRDITKLYPGVVALDSVSIDFRAGEVHAIVGENGAGKSTLIKVIAGAVEPDGGSVIIDGESYNHMTPKLSRGLGIEVIYQEYNLIGTLSAAENVCLGEKTGRLVNFREMERKTSGLFEQFKIDIDPKTRVDDLTSAKMQIVEIAKAVSKNVRLLIMDEPSAPLTVPEVAIMMDIVKRLKSSGVTILYISHRLEEVFQIADRVSILRDGQYVCTRDVEGLTRKEMISLMVGRELSETHPVRTHELGEVVLEADNVSGNGDSDISFKLRRGEVLGFSGLVGSGRTELMRLIYGVDKMEEGQIRIGGRKVRINSEGAAKALGIGFIPEDRKKHGCFLDMDIVWNTSINNIENISKRGLVDRKREMEIAQYYEKALRIKTPDLRQLVRNLSGGNQQKVVIAKTLAATADILIFDEPTRGIDVNAKHEIYLLMNELTAQGKSIIMVSSDMEELLGMSDRIIVLHEGRFAGEIGRDRFFQNYILELASGGTIRDAEALLS